MGDGRPRGQEDVKPLEKASLASAFTTNAVRLTAAAVSCTSISPVRLDMSSIVLPEGRGYVVRSTRDQSIVCRSGE